MYLCLYRYQTDVTSPRLGCVIDDAQHAVCIGPHGDDGEVGGGKVEQVGEGGREASTVVLNQGAGIRPAADPRGWKWKGDVALQRDASLLHEPCAVARIAYQEHAWAAGLGYCDG